MAKCYATADIKHATVHIIDYSRKVARTPWQGNRTGIACEVTTMGVVKRRAFLTIESRSNHAAKAAIDDCKL